MAEFTQFTITDKAVAVANRFVEEKWFDSANEAGIFAASYVIRKHYNEVDPASLHYGSSNHNYSYTTFDPDGSKETLIKYLYETDTPRAFYRNLIIWGLEDIGNKIDETGFLQLSDYI